MNLTLKIVRINLRKNSSFLEDIFIYPKVAKLIR
jgi:hypothetical protein